MPSVTVPRLGWALSRSLTIRSMTLERSSYEERNEGDEEEDADDDGRLNSPFRSIRSSS